MWKIFSTQSSSLDQILYHFISLMSEIFSSAPISQLPKWEYVNVTSGLYYNSFTIVIYDCNDSNLYHKTMIIIVSYAPNLALSLASVINYDRKWHHNLKRHLLTIIMCLWYRPQIGQLKNSYKTYLGPMLLAADIPLLVVKNNPC